MRLTTSPTLLRLVSVYIRSRARELAGKGAPDRLGQEDALYNGQVRSSKLIIGRGGQRLRPFGASPVCVVGSYM